MYYTGAHDLQVQRFLCVATTYINKSLKIRMITYVGQQTHIIIQPARILKINGNIMVERYVT